MATAARKPGAWLQHRAVKPAVFVLSLLPFAWLLWGAVANTLGPNPAEALIRGTPLAEPRLLRTIALAHRKDVALSRTARAFWRVLMSYLGTLTKAELGEDLEVIAPTEKLKRI